MVRPPFEIVNEVLPPRTAPNAPVTPTDGPLRIVIWPPVLKVWLPTSVRSTELLAGM